MLLAQPAGDAGAGLVVRAASDAEVAGCYDVVFGHYWRALRRAGEGLNDAAARHYAQREIAVWRQPAAADVSQRRLILASAASEREVGLLWWREATERGRGELAYLWIAEGERRHGYARAALAWLEVELSVLRLQQARPIKVIELHVFVHNRAAINLYVAAGYQQTRAVRLYDAVVPSRLRMCKRLPPPVF